MPLNIPRDLSATYTRFGVTLGRLNLGEIEFLRARRNDPALSQFLIFREEISAEQQLAWFNSVDNRKNLYGTVYWQGKFIGLTNLRDIDEEACSAEGGMMIWDEEYQNSIVPFRAALVGTDLAFWEYGFQLMKVRVLASNKRAIRFNKALGYVFDDTPDADGAIHGRLSNAAYWKATMSIRKVLDEQDGTENGGEGWPVFIPPLPREP